MATFRCVATHIVVFSTVANLEMYFAGREFITDFKPRFKLVLHRVRTVLTCAHNTGRDWLERWLAQRKTISSAQSIMH